MYRKLVMDRGKNRETLCDKRNAQCDNVVKQTLKNLYIEESR